MKIKKSLLVLVLGLLSSALYAVTLPTTGISYTSSFTDDDFSALTTSYSADASEISTVSVTATDFDGCMGGTPGAYAQTLYDYYLANGKSPKPAELTDALLVALLNLDYEAKYNQCSQQYTTSYTVLSWYGAFFTSYVNLTGEPPVGWVPLDTSVWFMIFMAAGYMSFVLIRKRRAHKA